MAAAAAGVGAGAGAGASGCTTEAGSDFGDVNMTIRLALSLQEEHHKHTIYACRFCDNIPAYADYFATVAGTWVSVYRVTGAGIEGGVRVDLEQAFSDADVEEVLYCVTWASTGSNVPVLMVAGKQGTIKGIMMGSLFELRSILLGHGDAVYDLRTHPVDDGLVLSASKDESIRLWNVRTSVCIAVFAGAGGHRGAVLAIDIHPLGNVFASSGMDTTIKIWNLEKPDLCSAIDLSDSNPRGPAGNHNFRSVSQQDPLYSTNQVHMNYVDSVKWVGDFLLTKATGEAVTLWAPDSTRYAGAALILRTFHLPLFKIWYAQMDVFVPFDVFCVGNDDGRVFLYNISKTTEKDEKDSATVQTISASSASASQESSNTKFMPASKRATFVLGNSVLTTRCVSFHVEGKYVLSSNEAGEICLWTLLPNE